MEIMIREMNAAVVKALDEKAAGLGMSRQKYLKLQLERLATVDVFREERNEYATLVKNMGIIIGNNTEQLQSVAELLEDIKLQMGVRADGQDSETYQSEQGG